MCGLVYANSFDGSSVNKLVWKQFDKQRSRGVQGFGFFNGRYTIKAALEKRIKHKLESKRNQTDLLLFHHRFPTSTENVKRAAHPFNTGDYFGNVRYVLIHNGVVRNARSVREKHIALEKPIQYQSLLDNGKFNDSEALLWDFALTMEGKQKDLTAYGDIAFICIRLVDNVPEQMYFGRNGMRPLKMKRDKFSMMLSSEGEGEVVKAATLYTYHYKKKRLNQKFFRIPSYDPSSSTWNYGKGYKGATKGGNYSGSGTSHAHNPAPNVCATPSPNTVPKHSGGNFTIHWTELCEHDDIIFDSSGVAHYPSEITFYQDGSYDLWNEFKETWETGYWLGEEFSYSSRSTQQKSSEKKKFMDFIPTPKKPRTQPTKQVDGAIVRSIIKPKQEDVALLIFEEIGKANGYYDAAYFSIENHWVDLVQKYDGITPPIVDRKAIALYEEAMKQIEAIPEYIDSRSLHPLWQAPVEEEGKQTNFLKLLPKGEKQYAR